MPDSGRSAATGYSRASGVPYREAIIPNRYVGRTFIKPTTGRARRRSPHEAQHHRGHRPRPTRRRRGRLHRPRHHNPHQDGPAPRRRRKGDPPPHRLAAHPPRCFFGVDFPDASQLIANKCDVDQVRQALGVDSLHYISLEGLLAAAASKTTDPEHFCTACYSAEYRINVDPSTNKEVFQAYRHPS